MRQRVVRLCGALIAAGTLGACVVPPGPVVVERPRGWWAPGHWTGNGYWVPGHWR